MTFGPHPPNAARSLPIPTRDTVSGRLATEDRHAGHRPGAAQVVREADPGPLHLPLARLAAELRHELVDHAHAGGADRVPVRLETARRVHRLLAAERRTPLLDESAALAAAAEAEILVGQDLGDGEAVVHLGEVDGVGADPRLRVGLLRGAHRRLEPDVAEAWAVVRLAGHHGEPDAERPDGRAAERARDVGAAD